MTNELKVIHEQEVLEQSFRIYGSKEEPLFLARDVAYWIEYSQSNVSKLVNMVDEEEKVRKNVTTLGGIQESWFLTEDGLYEVLMQSRKPIAKQFSRLNFQQLIFR
ncbi:TPA: Bro-N domain-containing protein [Bacillus mobilis]|uniref:BRO-N domain-containing protein n=1 Tax=Bacillus mobilis TaxID=2026190 RepID=UPI0011A17D07|nr:Bro-N domain-containing protein [Bacillus mobilis]MED4387039.1 Bro-N domain-containing protein [Bacillus mobilis]HDX9640897.1 Bro-N domain-containing protein [Bacillus mobilis]